MEWKYYHRVKGNWDTTNYYLPVFLTWFEPDFEGRYLFDKWNFLP